MDRIFNKFKRKPLRKGQPLYKRQMVCSRCSEVLLYIKLDQVRQETRSDLKQASSYFTHLPRFVLPPVFDLLSCKESKLELAEGRGMRLATTHHFYQEERTYFLQNPSTHLCWKAPLYRSGTHIVKSCLLYHLLLNYHKCVYTLHTVHMKNTAEAQKVQ